MAHVDRDRLAYFLSKLQSWVASYAPSKDVATTYSPGLMSASDKAKLDGLNVDAALNAASFNPVQNRAIAQALQSLADRVGSLEDAGSTTYTYKGSVPTYADLPSSGNQVGDVYDVLTAPDDGSWAWDGTSWNKLSGFVDLSSLATKDVATPTSNGLMSAADKASFDALMQGFVPLWSNLQDYSASMLLRGSDGALYFSVQASGPGTAGGAQNPVSDSAGTYWKKISADDSALVHLSGSETVTGQKTFTQPIVGDVTGSAASAATAGYADAAGGFAQWSSGADYAPGSAVLGSDGKIYYASAASGPGSGGASDPVSDGGAHWTRAASDDSALVHLSGAETVTGQKTFSQPVLGDVSVAAAGTGTQARLLSERAADFVNVKDFGAAGDGAADDTAAFQAAAAAAGSRVVLVPEGTYRVDSQIENGLFRFDAGARLAGPGSVPVDDSSFYSIRGVLAYFDTPSMPLGPVESNHANPSNPTCWDRVCQSFAIDPAESILYMTSNVASTGATCIYAYHWDEKVPSRRELVAKSSWAFQTFAHQGLGLYRPDGASKPKFFTGGNQYVTSLSDTDPADLFKLKLIRWNYETDSSVTVERTWTIFDGAEFTAGTTNVCVSPDGRWLAAKRVRTADGAMIVRVWRVDLLLSMAGSDARDNYTYSIEMPPEFVSSQGMAVADGYIFGMASLANYGSHYICCVDFKGNLVTYRTPTRESQEVDTLLSASGYDTVYEGEGLNFAVVGGRITLLLMVGLLTYPGGNYCRRQLFYDLTCGIASNFENLSKYAGTVGGTDPDKLWTPGLHYGTTGFASHLGLFNGTGYFINLRCHSYGKYIVQFLVRGNEPHQIWSRLGTFSRVDNEFTVMWNNFAPLTNATTLFGDVDLNSFVEPGKYAVTGGSNYPQGSNGNLIVVAGEGHYIRQLFFRHGTRNANEHQIWTREGYEVETSEEYPYGVAWGDWIRIITGKNPIFAEAPQPEVTDTISCGLPNRVWTHVYASSGTVETSDERFKDNVSAIDERLMRAWGRVGFKLYQFKDALEKKGQSARVHAGVLAQDISRAFAAEGLDASRYGLFCYDEWPDRWEEETVVDAAAVYDEETGALVSPERTHVSRVKVQEAGSRYGVRYEEVLALECAYQRWLGEKRDAEIAALKARLGA